MIQTAVCEVEEGGEFQESAHGLSTNCMRQILRGNVFIFITSAFTSDNPKEYSQRCDCVGVLIGEICRIWV